MKLHRDGAEELAGAISIIVISFLSYYCLPKLFLKGMAGSYLQFFVSQAFFAVPVLAGTIITGRTGIYRPDPEKLAEGWTSALLLIILVILPLSMQVVTGHASITVSPEKILLFAGHMFLIGYCEETLFRGILQNAFLRLFGEDSLAGARLSVLCAGLLFGGLHLLNAVHPEISPGTAAVQACATSALGMYLCAVYFRTGKNLWFCIVLHALNDALVNIVNGVLDGSSVVSTVVNTNQITSAKILVPVLVYGSAAAVLMRRKKAEPLLQKKDPEN